MKISLEAGNGYLIHSYEPGKVEILQSIIRADLQASSSARTTYTDSLLISQDVLIPNWQVVHDDTLSSEHIKAIIETEPEVVLIGTGKKIELCHFKVVPEFHKLNIGVEIMDTGAACRTYNVLASEGRKVTAALLML